MPKLKPSKIRRGDFIVHSAYGVGRFEGLEEQTELNEVRAPPAIDLAFSSPTRHRRPSRVAWRPPPWRQALYAALLCLAASVQVFLAIAIVELATIKNTYGDGELSVHELRAGSTNPFSSRALPSRAPSRSVSMWGWFGKSWCTTMSSFPRVPLSMVTATWPFP